MRFIVAFVAQLVEPGFEIWLMLAQFECCQNAPIIGAVAAVMEQ